MNEAKLTTRLQGKLDNAQANLNAFAQKFATDPVHTLIWSQSTFEDAAKIEVYQDALNVIENMQGEDVIQIIKDDAQYNLLRLTRSANNYSTSATDNLMNDARMKVLADLLEMLD